MKPKRSNFPEGSKGQALYMKALKVWSNRQIAEGLGITKFKKPNPANSPENIKATSKKATDMPPSRRKR